MSPEAPKPAAKDPAASPTAEAPKATIPTSPESSAGTPKTAIPESIPASDADVHFSSKNKGFFEKMSGGAKGLLGKVYEGINKIPVVNTIVAKFEIAYKKLETYYYQHEYNARENKALGFKTEMESLDLEIQTLATQRAQLESIATTASIPQLKAELQKQLKEIDRETMHLKIDRDELHSKFEERENQAKLFADKRDRVAERVIRNYDEQLAPMEKELAVLQGVKNEVDLSIAVAELKHKKSLDDIAKIEKQKTTIEAGFRGIGYSEKEISGKGAVKLLEKQITAGRKKIQLEKDVLSLRREKISTQIAEADALANPYRDKREKFVRLKNDRPIDISEPTRSRETEFVGKENVSAHTRTESEAAAETTTLTAEEADKYTVKALVGAWNEYVVAAEKAKKQDDPSIENLSVDAKAFLLQLDRAGFSNASPLNSDPVSGDLKLVENILEKYLAAKKPDVPEASRKALHKHFEAFLKDYTKRT